MGRKPSSRGISIKEALTLKEEDEISEKVHLQKNLPKDAFNAQDVLNFWNDFVETFKEKNQIPTYNALHTLEPVVQEDVVLFKAESAFSLSELDAHRNEFLGKLHQHLNNYSIRIETRIEENKNSQHILTKEELYQQMVAENPLLEQMKKDFGLDLYD